MKHIHFVGIGGISQSALALLCKEKGYTVSGSDTTLSDITKRLFASGVTVYKGHHASNISGADLIVVSNAISKDNPELVAAKEQKIKVISRAQLLASICRGYKKVISVAGTHGKTTTTGMLATIFLLAGKNPTVHIGGELPLIGGNVYIGGKEYFITEACEYCDSFLKLKSYASVILNIQKDHMDYFKKMANLQKSFNKFAKNTKDGGYLVKNNDDARCQKITKCGLSILFAVSNMQQYNPNAAHIMAKNIAADEENKYSYDLFVCGQNMGRVLLSVPGKHNISNSLAATAVALQEGIGPDVIIMALGKYKSSKRRYQQICTYKGAKIIHDYAHHPTEIAATISATIGCSSGALHVVFEPHTYSRTKYLYKEFCNCFDGADSIIIPPIYPAREQPIAGVTNNWLVKGLIAKGKDATAASSLSHAFAILNKQIKPNDTVLLLGAGTIEHMSSMFLKK